MKDDTAFISFAFHANNAANHAVAAYWQRGTSGESFECLKGEVLSDIRKAAASLGYVLVEKDAKPVPQAAE